MTTASVPCSGVNGGVQATAGEAWIMEFAVYRTPWMFNLRHGGGVCRRHRAEDDKAAVVAAVNVDGCAEHRA